MTSTATQQPTAYLDRVNGLFTQIERWSRQRDLTNSRYSIQLNEEAYGRRRCQPQFIDQQCAGTFRWRSLAKPREDHEPEVLACIEATFIAEYRYDEELDEKGLGEFAHRNAGYHIWPFWREYLVSQCDRMRLPRVIVPTMRV